MKRIRKVAVLGAGTMGSQIAAHVANAGFEVQLYDLSKDLAKQGLRRALEAKIPAFMDKEFARYVKTFSFDEIENLKDVDWVVEAVVEKLDVKREIFAKVEKVVKEDAIISTNTSGIPIKLIAEGRSESFRKRFLGTHFFNPPRYMKLLEIIPSEDTESWVIESISKFAQEELGKGIVYAKDTPNFIANRIGVFALMSAIRSALELGLSVEEVDAITGKLIGRPRTATFRLADLVGIDVIVHVANNIYEFAKHDEFREFFKVPEFMQYMVENKLLGDKTKAGFYKKEGERRLVFDIESKQYREPKKVSFPELQVLENVKLEERFKAIYEAEGKGAEFLRRVFTYTLMYSAYRIPEVSDEIYNVDNALKWGFNWKYGPFETFDLVGLEVVLEHARSLNINEPELVRKLISANRRTFYEGQKYFDIHTGDYKEVPRRKEVIVISQLKDRTLEANAEASLIDLGDGVLLVEFHSKANAIGFGTLQMLNKAMDIAESDERWLGIVIANDDENNFSAGANLGLMATAIGEGAYDEVERAINLFQKTFMRMKYFHKPVVSAPFGRALGGGCELVMHSSRRVAHAELYTGLVELGVGLIPAAGGTKEFTIRALKRIPETAENADPFPIFAEFFKQIGMAKVSSSAYEAKKMGILTDGDIIVMNRDFLTYHAKQMVIGLSKAGYRPPHGPERVRMLGWDGYANVLASLVNLRKGGFITEYEEYMLKRLAYVMTGGPDVAPGTPMDEWDILRMEKEVFMELIRQPKTQERIFHMLKYKKPLRN